jgi:hypothetical protein
MGCVSCFSMMYHFCLCTRGQQHLFVWRWREGLVNKEMHHRVLVRC